MTNTVVEQQLIEALQAVLPIDLVEHKIEGRVGLVIVDEVNGFCTVGMGNLAPAAQSVQIEQMVSETNCLAKLFVEHNFPILALRDTHDADRPEPPYPPHCILGTGEEELVPTLQWLETAQRAGKKVEFLNKDCINGFVGGIMLHPDWEGQQNSVINWLHRGKLETVIVVGICTDICVEDFVTTLLSARNHAATGYEKPTTMLMPDLKDVVVYEPGCSTYDLPIEVVRKLKFPMTAVHPQDAWHHIGLKTMAMRGAILANRLLLSDGTLISLKP